MARAKTRKSKTTKPKGKTRKKTTGSSRARAKSKSTANARTKVSGKAMKKPRPPLKPGPDGVVRLAGGNPQIPKGEGDAPVKAYLRAMPGWKRAVGERLDAIIAREVPGLRRAVKWNSPLYGVEPKSWFMSFHCFDKYVKVAFFKGASLKPVPPGTSKHAQMRYLDVREKEPLDEAQFADWVRQASKLPGEIM